MLVLVAFPVENDLQFGPRTGAATSNALNFQPIIPFRADPLRKIATRTIIPVEYVDPAGERARPENREWGISIPFIQRE